MKNVLVYNIVDDKKRYDNELLFNYFRAQVDNSLRLGWKKEDIIIGTNFDFEHNFEMVSWLKICHLLDSQNKRISEIIKDLPKTYQSPTMAPYCEDEEKYSLINEMVEKIKKLKNANVKIDNLKITEILTVNACCKLLILLIDEFIDRLPSKPDLMYLKILEIINK